MCQQLAPILCNVARLCHNHSASFGYITKCAICVSVAKVSTETLNGIGSILCVSLCTFMFQDGEDLLEAKPSA